MITLDDLRQMTKDCFPGRPLGIPEILTTWCEKGPEKELARLLENNGITTSGMIKALKPLLGVEEHTDSDLLIACITSVSGQSVKGIHLVKALFKKADHRVTLALIKEGLNVRATLTNIEELLAQKQDTTLAALGIRVDTKSTPMLKYGRDLTILAAEGAFDELCPLPYQLSKLTDVLMRKRKGNPVLTGPAGTGKTALVELLAVDMVKNGSSPFAKYRLYELSMGRLVAGTKYRGEFEARFEEVLQGIIKAAPAILFIDEIHLLLGAGRAEGAAMDGANLIKPFLARDHMRVIGATTDAEYHRYIGKDEALARRFQVIKIKEPDADTLFIMVRQQADALMVHHGIKITDAIINKAIELANRHMVTRHQPDKTIDLLDSAAVAVRREKGTAIEGDDLLNTVSRLMGIPVGTLTGHDRQLLRNMIKGLSSRVIGQEEAIKKTVSTLIQRRLDLGRTDRPLGVFLFAGDTGVGKTELARSLSRYFFGDEKRLIHLDLAEYPGSTGAQKLIGAPPGFVGYEDESPLIRGLQKYPSAVVLFDEVEKSGPEVHTLLLGLLDNGRIRSGRGEQFDARQCVIIMTTNAVTSADLEKKAIGFGCNTPVDLRKLLESTFPREFLGRIDEIIPFKKLTEKDFGKIIKLRLDETVAGLKEKGIRFVYDEARLLEYLRRETGKEQNGARGIAGILERRVLQPLAMALLNSSEEKETVIEADEEFYRTGSFAEAEHIF